MSVLDTLIAQNDEELRKLNSPPPIAKKEEAPGIARRIWDRYSSGVNSTLVAPVAGIVEGVGNATGIPAIANVGKAARENAEAYVQDVEARNPRHTFSDAQTAGDYANAAFDTLVENAPQLVVGGLAARGGAALAGAAGRATGLIKTADALNKAKVAGALAGGTAQNVATEAGSIYNDQAEGQKSLGKAFAYGIPAGLIETGAEALTVAKSGLGKYITDTAKEAALPAFQKQGIRGLTKQGLKTMGIGALSEGGEELAQNPLEYMGAGKALFDQQGNIHPELKRDLYEGFMGGAAIGGILGGGGHAYSSARNKAAISALASPETRPDVRAALANNAALALPEDKQAAWTAYAGDRIANAEAIGLDPAEFDGYVSQRQPAPPPISVAPAPTLPPPTGPISRALNASPEAVLPQIGYNPAQTSEAVSTSFLDPAMRQAVEQRRGPAPVAEALPGEAQQAAYNQLFANPATPISRDALAEAEANMADPMLAAQMAETRSDKGRKVRDQQRGITVGEGTLTTPYRPDFVMQPQQAETPASSNLPAVRADYTPAVTAEVKKLEAQKSNLERILFKRDGNMKDKFPPQSMEAYKRVTARISELAQQKGATQNGNMPVVSQEGSQGQAQVSDLRNQDGLKGGGPNGQKEGRRQEVLNQEGATPLDNSGIPNNPSAPRPPASKFNVGDRVTNGQGVEGDVYRILPPPEGKTEPSVHVKWDWSKYPEKQPGELRVSDSVLPSSELAHVTTEPHPSSTEGDRGPSEGASPATHAQETPVPSTRPADVNKETVQANPQHAAAQSLIANKRKPPQLFTIPNPEHKMDKYVFADDGKKLSLVRPDGAIEKASAFVKGRVEALRKRGEVQGYSAPKVEQPLNKLAEARLNHLEKKDTLTPEQEKEREKLKGRKDGGKADKAQPAMQEPRPDGIYQTRMKIGDSIETRYAVPAPESMGYKRGHGDELYPTIEEAEAALKERNEREATNAKFHQEQDARLAKEKAEQDAKDDTRGFYDTLSIMAAGKAKKTLEKGITHKGIVTRLKEFVEKKVADGYTIGEWDGKAVLKSPDGSFYDQSMITKTAIDYARHLIDLQESTPDTPAEVVKEAVKVAKEEAPPVKQSLTTEPTNKESLTVEGKIDTLAAHEAFGERLETGDVTPEELQTAFASFLENEGAIKAEMEKKTKDELLKALGGYAAQRYKNDKKADIIRQVWHSMLGDFNLNRSVSYNPFGGGGYESAIKTAVSTITEKDITNYADEVAKAREEYKARVEQYKQALTDPQTLEDFRDLLRVEQAKGKTLKDARLALTPEQQERYDNLAAEASRTRRKDQQNDRRTEVRAASQSMTGEVIETKHTKTGIDLFVVKAAERVERDVFNQWNATAKKLGGYYSAFRGNGAVPGFQFKAREAADAFLQFLGGDTTGAKEAVQARRNSFEDDRSQSATERLNEMADRLEASATERLTRDRKTNTARRAGMAASAEAQARRDEAMAKTMRQIATAIANGTTTFLDRVRTKVQVEMLNSFVNSARNDWAYAESKKEGSKRREELLDMAPSKEMITFAEFPTFTAYRSDLAGLGRALESIDGAKKLGASILKVADDVTKEYEKFAKENLHKVSTFTTKDGGMAVFPSRDAALESINRSGYKGKAIAISFKRGEHLVIMGPQMAKEHGVWEGDNDKRITLSSEVGEELVAKSKELKRQGVTIPWTFEAAQEKRQRLSSMGIENGPELRAALREYLNLREQPKEADKIKEMERKMIGRKNDGLDFFPTPPAVAQEMVDTADIQEGMAVLEPSAGMGHIAEAIRESGVEPDVSEMSGDRRELLEAKGFNVVAHDFMDVAGQYDRIIMNPPFSNRRDAEHVRHAYTLLKPNGRVVAIMGEGVFFGQDKKAVEFRNWLESVGGTSEKLEEGTFLDPSLPVNTGVNARMVVIDKQEGGNNASQTQGPGIVDLSSRRGSTDGLGREGGVSNTGKYSLTESESQPLTREKVESAFPGQKVTENWDGFTVNTPSGLEIKISKVGSIYFDMEAAEAAYGRKIGEHERPVAAWQEFDNGGIISLTEDGIGEIHHETFHAAMSLVLTDRQIAGVLKKYGTEENAAQAYQTWRDQGDAKKPHIWWQRIFNFFRNLREMVSPTAQGTFEKIASGKAWKQTPNIITTPEIFNAPEMQGIFALADKLEGKIPQYMVAAWHGSPHDFDKFSTSAIGTGEGAQAYGYGLYFAGAREVAEWYRDNVRRESASELGRTLKEYSPDAYSKLDKATRTNAFYGTGDGAVGYLIQNINSAGTHSALGDDWKLVYDAIKSMPGSGRLYQVELAPEEDEFLLWDKPLSEQSEKVQSAIAKVKYGDGSWQYLNGRTIYKEIANARGRELAEKSNGAIRPEPDDAWASDYLHSLGVRGIKYLDGTSRGKGDGVYNYVVFSDEDVKIAAKYSLRSTVSDLRNHVTASRHPFVQGFLTSVFNSSKNLNAINKSVNTMYHVAEKLDKEGKGEFKSFLNETWDYVNDVSLLAINAESLAPSFFRKMNNVKEWFGMVKEAAQELNPQKAKEIKESNARIASALYDGTLEGGGDPMKGKIFSSAELKEQYKMNDKEIAAYHEALAAVGQSLDDTGKSIIYRTAQTLDTVLTDRSLELDDMAQDVTDQIDSRLEDAQAALEQHQEEYWNSVEGLDTKSDEFKKLRKESDKFEKSQTQLIDTLENAKESIDGVARKIKSLKAHGYFPLMRFGNFAVTVRDSNNEVAYFSMHETETEAQAAKIRLAQRYKGDSIVVAPVNNEKAKLWSGLSLDAVQLFAEHLDKEDAAAYQEYLKSAVNNRSALARQIHRKGMPGYDENATRTLAAFITSNARLASGNYHSLEIQRRLQAFPQEQGDVQKMAQELHDYLQNPREEMSRLRGFLFLHYMGFAFDSAMTNLTQIPMMTAPWLMQHAKGKKVVEFLTAAAKISNTPANAIRDEMLKRAVKRSEAEGITAPQEIHQLTAIAMNRLGAGNKAAHAFMTAAGGMFSVAESMNRRITFVAAFNVARGNGMTEAKAYDFAKKAVIETQGMYSRANRPVWSRGPIGATVMTFKQYSIMYLEMFKRLPPKQKAIMLGLLMLGSGAEGLPFYEDGADILDTILQWAGFAANTKRTVRDTTKAVLGEKVGNAALRGISSVLPIDVQLRLSFGNLIPGTSILKKSMAGADKTREFADMLGASGGVLSSLADAMEMAAVGNKEGVMRSALPLRSMKNLYEGGKMVATGTATDKRGRMIDNVTTGEGLAKMIGYRSSRLAEDSKTKTYYMEDRNLVRVKREEIADRMAQAIINRDKAGLLEARQDMLDWNKKNPELAIKVTGQSVARRVKAARLSSNERFVKSMGKAQRKQVMTELKGEEP